MSTRYWPTLTTGRNVRKDVQNIVTRQNNIERKAIMPKTIDKTYEGQIIGGIFKNEDDAEKAIEAFDKLDIPEHDIETIVQLDDDKAEEVYIDLLSDRGFSDSQALYYDGILRAGKVLVVVSEVTNPAPVIDIVDKFKAEYNPNGSRDLREDVLGMTAGAAVGAAALGAVGAVVAGPVGSVVGGVAGAVVGGGSGAAAGKAVEHKK
jgi:hypothetical protein